MLSGNVGGLTHESVHSVVEPIELVPLLLVIQRVVLGFKFKQFAVKFGESIHMTYTGTHEAHQILLTGLLTLPDGSRLMPYPPAAGAGRPKSGPMALDGTGVSHLGQLMALV
jgi:hypothetical protein